MTHENTTVSRALCAAGAATCLLALPSLAHADAVIGEPNPRGGGNERFVLSSRLPVVVGGALKR